MTQEKEIIGYIDCTPTWEGLLPAMLAILENPNASFDSRKIVMEELTRMAQLADKYKTLYNRYKEL